MIRSASSPLPEAMTLGASSDGSYLIEQHISLLDERLTKRGYALKAQFKIKEEDEAQDGGIRRQILLVRVHIEIAVRVIAGQLKRQLDIGEHMIHLVHKVHIVLQVLYTPRHRQICLARRLHRLMQTHTLLPDAFVELLHSRRC